MLAAFCLLMFEQAAGLEGSARVDGVAPLGDLPDDALLVDHERVAVRKTDERDEDVVQTRNGLVFIAEDGELHAQRFGEGLVLGAVVYADADDLRARLLEFGDISLIRPKFLRSAAGESFDVKSQYQALLAVEIAEANRLTVLVR
jgi:hypothetical protein